MIWSVFGSKKYCTYTVHTRRLAVCTLKRPHISPIMNFKKGLKQFKKSTDIYNIYNIYRKYIVYILYICFINLKSVLG